MSLLAIDSSAEICSVALFTKCLDLFSVADFDKNVSELIETTPRQHSQKLLPLLDDVMAISEMQLADLTAFVVGAGPGSFTGLRIAAGLVQGLAFALDKPVIGICSLRAFAQYACDYHGLADDSEILVAIDARMNEAYWQVFTIQQGLAHVIKEDDSPRVGKLSGIEFKASERTLLIGDAWQVYDAQTLGERIDLPSFPSAQSFLKLACYDLSQGLDVAVTAQHYTPAYVRNTVSWKKLHEQ